MRALSPEAAGTGHLAQGGTPGHRLTPIVAWILQRLLADPTEVSKADRETLPEWLQAATARLEDSPSGRQRTTALKAGLTSVGLSEFDVQAVLKALVNAPADRPTPVDSEEEWDLPIPLVTMDMPLFPADSFPPWLRDMVGAVAVANQTADDVPAMICLAVLATALAGTFEIELRPGWVEPLNLWTAVALPSGERKTPVFREIAAPIFQFQKTEMERLGPAIAEARVRREIEESTLDRAKRDAAKLDGPEADEALQRAIRIEQDLAGSRPPVDPRLVAQDVTPEGLANMMPKHGERMAILSAESEIFDQMAGRYSNDGHANFDIFLKSHAGEPIFVDRKGSESVLLQRPLLTLGLAVQPAALQALAGVRGARERGMLARILYSLPPSLVGWRESDSPAVPDIVRQLYFEGVLALIHAGRLLDDTEPRRLASTPEANAFLLRFEREIEYDLRPGGTLFGIKDWGSKLAGAVGRIMGLLHLANSATTDGYVVQAKTAEAAIMIGKYLIPHALAAFGLMGANSALGPAQSVLDWIRGTRQEIFSKRDAFEKLKGRFPTAKDLDEPLHLLEEHGYIRSQEPAPRTGPGRKPSPIYEVNPCAQYSHNSQNGSES